MSSPPSSDLPVRVPSVVRDLTVTAEMEPIRDEPPTGRRWRARLALIAASVVMLALAVLAVGRALVPGSSAPGAPVQLAASPPGPPPATSSVDSAAPPAPAVPTTAFTSRGSSATRTTSPAGGAAAEPATPTKTTDEPLAVVGGGFTAAYSVDQRWPGGFIARVAITNSGETAQPWQVTVRYPPTVAGFVADWSNASVQPHTDATPRSATIAGAAPLAAGHSVDVFVQFIAMGGNIAPTECSVNATPCSQT